MSLKASDCDEVEIELSLNTVLLNLYIILKQRSKYQHIPSTSSRAHSIDVYYTLNKQRQLLLLLYHNYLRRCITFLFSALKTSYWQLTTTIHLIKHEPPAIRVKNGQTGNAHLGG